MSEKVFKTKAKPTHIIKELLKQSTLDSQEEYFYLYGIINVLFKQGFMSFYTYQRYFRLLNSLAQGTSKLRNRITK
jgi:hypothetical protein